MIIKYCFFGDSENEMGGVDELEFLDSDSSFDVELNGDYLISIPDVEMYEFYLKLKERFNNGSKKNV